MMPKNALHNPSLTKIQLQPIDFNRLNFAKKNLQMHLNYSNKFSRY